MTSMSDSDPVNQSVDPAKPRRSPARLKSRLRASLARIYRGVRSRVTGRRSVISEDDLYREWIGRNEHLVEHFIGEQLASCLDRPLISVVMPTYNTNPEALEQAVHSVMAQVYDRWELCIVDDASTDEGTLGKLGELEAKDSRIKVQYRKENGHISAASNAGISQCSGEWIALLDHDDVLSPVALAGVVSGINANPDAALIYSDEDKIDEQGRRTVPFFKSDFDPLLLLAQNYICHFTVLRKSVLDAAGGFREGFEGAQDWDLFLRVTEIVAPEQIIHLPYVLYHWRMSSTSTSREVSAKPYAVNAGSRAVNEHLARGPVKAEVVTDPKSGWNRIRWALPEVLPSVTIVIPTRDGATLERCLETLFSLTTYSNFDVVIMDNGSQDPATFDRFERYSSTFPLRILRDDRPFNYSALNNAAVAATSADFICLMNDDIEITSGEWLGEMLSQFARPEVGIVGSKLLYPDGKLQHVGVVLGMGGVARHSFHQAPGNSTGYRGRHSLAHSVSCVTAACMVIRKTTWEELGGLNEQLAVSFNDVDFCIRASNTDWSIVWTPYAEMIHHESLSRGYDTTPEKARLFLSESTLVQEKWQRSLEGDPFYNPNLTLADSEWSLAERPRFLVRPGQRLDVNVLLKTGLGIHSENNSFVGMLSGEGAWTVAESDDSSIFEEIIPSRAARFIRIQSDGNPVMFDEQLLPVWASGTSNASPSHLRVTDEGSTELVDARGICYWTSSASL